MFTQISWGSYTTIVVVFLACYYLFVGFKYYRTDLLQLLSGKGISPDNTASFTATQKQVSVKPRQSLHKTNLQEAFEKQDLFQLAQSLSDEIQAYLNEAGRNKVVKEESMQSLKALVGKYPLLKDSSFHEFIQNLIETEFETNFSIHLSEEELSALWV